MINDYSVLQSCPKFDDFDPSCVVLCSERATCELSLSNGLSSSSDIRVASDRTIPQRERLNFIQDFSQNATNNTNCSSDLF